MSDSYETSASLLGKLRRSPTDQQAWLQFVNRYGPLIEQWCRRWGLRADDADEIVQNVLLQLSRQMSEFRYDADGSFRAWLKTVTYRAWCDFLKRQQRQKDAASGDTRVMQLLNSQEVRDDLTQRIDGEWRAELMETAMRSVKRRVQPHTWEAFRMMTQEGLSGAQVAERLDMKVGSVWVAKSKVLKMIQQEIEQLAQVD